jgi:phosphoribosyl 1,2-cyclic phosphodiesterase
MHNDFRIRVKFWGVRGSLPTPAIDNLGYGGNTTCLEVRSPRDRLIIDLGSGARNLGIELQQEPAGNRHSLNLLMTHFHWDHIQGLPFFAPLYSAVNDVTFHSSLSPDETRTILEGHMASPYYPVKFEYMAAAKRFIGGNLEPFHRGGFQIQPFPMNHPQGATGYRIERDGAVYVHASDLEHGDPNLDRILRDHSQNADVLVMDAQYTPEEYEMKRGWGHATWLEATRVARDCNVKQLVLFHHAPSHNDAFIDEIVNQAKRHFENTTAAKEGWVVEV